MKPKAEALPRLIVEVDQEDGNVFAWTEEEYKNISPKKVNDHLYIPANEHHATLERISAKLEDIEAELLKIKFTAASKSIRHAGVGLDMLQDLQATLDDERGTG